MFFMIEKQICTQRILFILKYRSASSAAISAFYFTKYAFPQHAKGRMYH